MDCGLRQDIPYLAVEKIHRMIFDWNQIMENIPDDWRATEGKGVKIAILDSGAELGHPAFNHLETAGHRFWVARSGYNPTAPPPPGNDDVADAKPDGVAHGTGCLSILAAKPETEDSGMKGLAPKAEFFIVKIAAADAASRNGDLVNAIELALKLDVDIIACSVLPLLTQTVSAGRLQQVFGKLTEQRTLLFTSLENTDLPEVLNDLQFPSDRLESIVSGVVSKELLEGLPANAVFDPRIAFLHPTVKVRQCRAPGYLNDQCSSSVATVALAGIAALRIAHWKNTETGYHRRTRTEVLAELRPLAQPFSVPEILTAQTPGFFLPANASV